eukprot:Nk52_evm84s2367 gene=Nk52_evmTU84s2367
MLCCVSVFGLVLKLISVEGGGGAARFVDRVGEYVRVHVFNYLPWFGSLRVSRSMVVCGVFAGLAVLTGVCGCSSVWLSLKQKKEEEEEEREEEEENLLRSGDKSGRRRYDGVVKKLEEYEECCVSDNTEMYSKSNLFRAASFGFATSLVRLGIQRPITGKDILNLERRDLPGRNADRIEEAYAEKVEEFLRTRAAAAAVVDGPNGYQSVPGEERRDDDEGSRDQLNDIAKFKESVSLVWIFFQSFWGEFMKVALLRMLKSIFQLTVAAYVLPRLLRYLREPEAGLEEGLMLTLMLFLFSSMQQLFMHQYFHHSVCGGLRLNGAFVLVVYRKILKLQASGSSVGELVNMVSNDSQRMFDFGIDFHNLYAGTIETICIISLIVHNAGSVGFLSLLIVLPFAPTMAFLGRKIGAFRGLVMKITDERMKMMNETLLGIKIVKMYCWEIPFAKVIRRLREKEIKRLWVRTFCSALTNILSTTMPMLVSLVVFTGYALIHGEMMDSATAFSTLALINLLRIPMVQLPRGIRTCSEVIISLNRLSKILSMKEISSAKYQQFDSSNPDALGVAMKKGCFDWGASGGNAELARATLMDISFSAKSGEILAVCGHVGAGKSSLLAAIMKEIPRLSGSVNLSGKIAYVPQEAFIMNASLRENILFGLPFEKSKYKQIIRTCCLEPDLLLLEDGDLTEIGERGMNISGGQKQRISMARALYSEADIYLLDDPLSAVDQHVGRKLFEDCISGYLGGKCVIFVTHQVQYLNQCDNVIFMKDGRIAETGTFDCLVATGSDFASFVSSHTETTKDEEKEAEEDASDIIEKKRSLSMRAMSVEGIQEDVHENRVDLLLKKETRSVGSIPLNVYLGYFERLGGLKVFWGVLMVFVFAETVKIGTDSWLSHWIRVSNMEEAAGVHMDQTFYISIYCSMIGGLLILGFLRAVCLYTVALKAAKSFHNAVYVNVIQAPMSFFDTTPVGQLLNRFSNDVSVVDESIPESLLFIMFLGCQIVGILLMIMYMFPMFICVLIPLGFVFNWFQQGFRFSARDLRRIELAARSPTYSLLSETLLGLVSVRAFGRDFSFQKEMEQRMQFTLSAMYSFWVANRWLGFRLDMLSCVVILFTGLFSVLSKGMISDSLIGLVLVYTLTLTGILQFAIRTTIEAESRFTSVQRLQEYTDKLKPERALGLSKDLELVMKGKEKDVSTLAVPSGWPKGGELSFKGFSMKYREALPDVLHSIDLNIQAGEKVGVVGRTGAGKSSLSVALFRLAEIQNMNGSIVLDGQNILNLPLWQLRRAISIIPQEPILFIGSVRYNLDPFNEVEDFEIWKALEKVHMLNVVEELPGKLDFQIVENGDNFSVGQRQLFCIGRSLLQKAKIILMDEATAAVDPETDQFVQATTREGFADCTVITIAHRVNTIIDCDKVLVMSKGTRNTTERRRCVPRVFEIMETQPFKCSTAQELEGPIALLRRRRSVLASRTTRSSSHLARLGFPVAVMATVFAVAIFLNTPNPTCAMLPSTSTLTGFAKTVHQGYTLLKGLIAQKENDRTGAYLFPQGTGDEMRDMKFSFAAPYEVGESPSVVLSTGHLEEIANSCRSLELFKKNPFSASKEAPRNVIEAVQNVNNNNQDVSLKVQTPKLENKLSRSNSKNQAEREESKNQDEHEESKDQDEQGERIEERIPTESSIISEFEDEELVCEFYHPKSYHGDNIFLDTYVPKPLSKEKESNNAEIDQKVPYVNDFGLGASRNVPLFEEYQNSIEKEFNKLYPECKKWYEKNVKTVSKEYEAYANAMSLRGGRARTPGEIPSHWLQYTKNSQPDSDLNSAFKTMFKKAREIKLKNHGADTITEKENSRYNEGEFLGHDAFGFRILKPPKYPMFSGTESDILKKGRTACVVRSLKLSETESHDNMNKFHDEEFFGESKSTLPIYAWYQQLKNGGVGKKQKRPAVVQRARGSPVAMTSKEYVMGDKEGKQGLMERTTFEVKNGNSISHEEFARFSREGGNAENKFLNHFLSNSEHAAERFDDKNNLDKVVKQRSKANDENPIKAEPDSSGKSFYLPHSILIDSFRVQASGAMIGLSNAMDAPIDQEMSSYVPEYNTKAFVVCGLYVGVLIDEKSLNAIFFAVCPKGVVDIHMAMDMSKDSLTFLYDFYSEEQTPESNENAYNKYKKNKEFKPSSGLQLWHFKTKDSPREALVPFQIVELKEDAIVKFQFNGHMYVVNLNTRVNSNMDYLFNDANNPYAIKNNVQVLHRNYESMQTALSGAEWLVPMFKVKFLTSLYIAAQHVDQRLFPRILGILTATKHHEASIQKHGMVDMIKELATSEVGKTHIHLAPLLTTFAEKYLYLLGALDIGMKEIEKRAVTQNYKSAVDYYTVKGRLDFTDEKLWENSFIMKKTELFEALLNGMELMTDVPTDKDKIANLRKNSNILLDCGLSYIDVLAILSHGFMYNKKEWSLKEKKKGENKRY